MWISIIFGSLFFLSVYSCSLLAIDKILADIKDLQGIVVDIGAGVGKNTLWLSKSFFHVLAVEPDETALHCLMMHTKKSDSKNVSLCSRRVDQVIQKHNYAIKAITFKQLIHDYIYTDKNLAAHRVSLITCDIGGEEENILEDILYFSYYNQTKVYMSFNLGRWKSKEISDFAYLLKFFKSNCPSSNICKYLKENPSASILFTPLQNAGVLIKKNMPVVIIGYNQFTYIKNIVQQLEKYTSDIIVVDNNSDYELLLDYYAHEYKYTLLKQKKNFGHLVYKKDFVQSLVGDIFILTDPDLKFHPKLPKNFIQTFINISNYFKAARVGFALCIEGGNLREDIQFKGQSIKSWEKGFWKKKLFYPKNTSLALYDAPIDTTFCLINKNFVKGNCIRVAGDYTCLHLPWYKNFKDILQPGECEAYARKNISSSWFFIKKERSRKRCNHD